MIEKLQREDFTNARAKTRAKKRAKIISEVLDDDSDGQPENEIVTSVKVRAFGVLTTDKAGVAATAEAAATAKAAAEAMQQKEVEAEDDDVEVIRNAYFFKYIQQGDTQEEADAKAKAKAKATAAEAAASAAASADTTTDNERKAANFSIDQLCELAIVLNSEQDGGEPSEGNGAILSIKDKALSLFDKTGITCKMKIDRNANTYFEVRAPSFEIAKEVISRVGGRIANASKLTSNNSVQIDKEFDVRACEARVVTSINAKIPNMLKQLHCWLGETDEDNASEEHPITSSVLRPKKNPSHLVINTKKGSSKVKHVEIWDKTGYVVMYLDFSCHLKCKDEKHDCEEKIKKVAMDFFEEHVFMLVKDWLYMMAIENTINTVDAVKPMSELPKPQLARTASSWMNRVKAWKTQAKIDEGDKRSIKVRAKALATTLRENAKSETQKAREAEVIESARTQREKAEKAKSEMEKTRGKEVRELRPKKDEKKQDSGKKKKKAKKHKKGDKKTETEEEEIIDETLIDEGFSKLEDDLQEARAAVEAKAAKILLTLKKKIKKGDLMRVAREAEIDSKDFKKYLAENWSGIVNLNNLNEKLSEKLEDIETDYDKWYAEELKNKAINLGLIKPGERRMKPQLINILNNFDASEKQMNKKFKKFTALDQNRKKPKPTALATKPNPVLEPGSDPVLEPGSNPVLEPGSNLVANPGRDLKEKKKKASNKASKKASKKTASASGTVETNNQNEKLKERTLNFVAKKMAIDETTDKFENLSSKINDFVDGVMASTMVTQDNKNNEIRKILTNQRVFGDYEKTLHAINTWLENEATRKKKADENDKRVADNLRKIEERSAQIAKAKTLLSKFKNQPAEMIKVRYEDEAGIEAKDVENFKKYFAKMWTILSKDDIAHFNGKIQAAVDKRAKPAAEPKQAAADKRAAEEQAAATAPAKKRHGHKERRESDSDSDSDSPMQPRETRHTT